jgi:hypothetical protein
LFARYLLYVSLRKHWAMRGRYGRADGRSHDGYNREHLTNWFHGNLTDGWKLGT